MFIEYITVSVFSWKRSIHIYIVVLKFMSILVAVIQARLIVLVYPTIFTKNVTSFFMKKNIYEPLYQIILPRKFWVLVPI